MGFNPGILNLFKLSKNEHSSVSLYLVLGLRLRVPSRARLLP